MIRSGQDALPDGAGDVSDEKLRQLEQEAKDLTSRLEVVSKEVSARSYHYNYTVHMAFFVCLITSVMLDYTPYSTHMPIVPVVVVVSSSGGGGEERGAH